MGRRPSGKYNISKMVKIIAAYTDAKEYPEIPFLQEVVLENGWDYDYVLELRGKKENEELARIIKRLYRKRELALERGILSGRIKEASGIFLLKQPCHGYTDKPKEDALQASNEKLAEVLKKIEGKI